MFRLISALFQPLIDYFSLTVIEPLQSLFLRAPKMPQRPANSRHPAPSVFRTIARQRQMVSPKEEYVQLPANVSVTNHYLRQSSQVSTDVRPQGYLH